mmetsp:Transcript_5287/g.14812  ORF Transcript_5287/g.14812 Transcript_5287/m.14812 type:complete len:235 (-) Transcript_5287:240-944(-)
MQGRGDPLQSAAPPSLAPSSRPSEVGTIAGAAWPPSTAEPSKSSPPVLARRQSAPAPSITTSTATTFGGCTPAPQPALAGTAATNATPTSPLPPRALPSWCSCASPSRPPPLARETSSRMAPPPTTRSLLSPPASMPSEAMQPQAGSPTPSPRPAASSAPRVPATSAAAPSPALKWLAPRLLTETPPASSAGEATTSKPLAALAALMALKLEPRPLVASIGDGPEPELNASATP